MNKFITFLLFLTLARNAPISAQGWQWGRICSGAGLDAWSTATDQSGNVFVAGINTNANQPVTFGTVAVPDAGLGSYQCVFAKYDGNGNLLWANATQNGNTNLISITTDPSGNLLVFGAFVSATVQIGHFTLTNPLPPDPQYFLAKIDPGGNVLWAVNGGYTQWNYIALGTTSALPGYAEVLGLGGVATDASGNIYITANFRMSSTAVGSITLINADPSGATDDILLVKYDPSGKLVWAKSAGGRGSDDAYSITVTPAGTVYIAGVFNSPSVTFGPSVITNSSGLQVAFIASYDGSGNPLWACASGGSGGDYAIGLASDISNNVYMTGGLRENSISFGGATITNPNASGKPVLYLVKFDPGNNVSWYKTIAPVLDSDFGAWGYSIAVSQCGTVWVSGCMHGAVDVDGHTLSPPAMSSDPIFMAGYSVSGTYAGSAALQSGGDDQDGIACDASGNVFMGCDYETSPFNIGTDTFPPPPPSSELLFVAKYASMLSPLINPTSIKTNFCLTGTVSLDAHAGYESYIWNDGSKTPARSVTDTGTFWVCASDSCTNAVVDTFKVTASCDCDKSLFVPNAFTPNGDGQDDIFYPRCGWNVKKIKTFRVYNRWGELLFERDNLEPNDGSNAWDGTYKGNLPLPDVYVWIVDAICDNGNEIDKKGSVTVIR